MRERIMAFLLAVAAGLITIGAFRCADFAGFIVAGILLGVWSWLVFGEVDG
jgi:hypothetical protein